MNLNEGILIHRKLHIVVMLIYFSISGLGAQECELIVDTVYSRAWEMDNFTLLSGDDNSIIINKDGIHPFVMLESTPVNSMRNDYLLVQVDGKTFYITDELELMPSSGLDVKLNDLSYEGQHTSVMGSVITYVVNDSIFVDNLKKPNKTFVQKGGYPFLNNEKYLFVKNSGLNKIYNMGTGKLFELPAEISSPETENEYLLIYTETDDFIDFKIQVLDLEMNEMIHPKENYNAYQTSRDLAIFYGNNKAKAFYKGVEMELPDEIVRVKYKEAADLWLVENSQGLMGIMNSEGSLIHDIVYNRIDMGYFSDKIRMFSSEKSYVVDLDGKVLFSGPYKDVDYLYDDRFTVMKNNKWAVVDSQSEIIIPFETGAAKKYISWREKGIELIMAETADESIFYNKNGEEIKRLECNGSKVDFIVSEYRLKNCQDIFESLTEEESYKMNKVNAWKIRKKVENKFFYRLIGHNGTPITKWHKGVNRTNAEGIFTVYTNSKKLGVIKVN